MKFTANQIAALLGGKVEGNPEASVSKLAKIEEGVPESICFLGSPKYNPYLYTTAASIVIVRTDFLLEKPLTNPTTLIRVEDPRKAFTVILEAYHQDKNNIQGIEEFSFVHPTALCGNEVYIGAFAYIGPKVKLGNRVKIYPNVFIGENVQVGDDTVIFSGSRVLAECIIGKNCSLHPGVIIGGDGFGFNPNSENNYEKVPQTGNVVIEDYVEIGSNTTIDRATLGSTIIRRGVKLDNLIQIAHNVEIGENTVMAAQCGVAGSTKIGKNCMIGGQVGIVGHLVIADGVKIAAQSGIGKSITLAGEIVQGSPAFQVREYRRAYVAFMQLPEILRQIKNLEQELTELKQMAEKHSQ